MASVRHRTVVAGAVATVTCLVAGACGSTSDADSGNSSGSVVGPSEAALYKAAKSNHETKVNVYGSQQTACYDEFQKKYPSIKVNYSYVVANLDQKVQQEHLTGKVLGDIVWTGSKSMLQINGAKEFVPFKPSSARSLPKFGVAPNKGFVMLTQHPTGGYLYNKKSLSAGEIPKSWHDFVDPKYKGKVVIPNPALGGTGTSLFMELVLSGSYTNEAWVKKFAANEPAKVENQANGRQAVQSGEYPILLGGISPSVAERDLKANPQLGYVPFIRGATPLVGTFAGVTTDAPHPHAAKLLLTWMSSVEGQSCMVREDREHPASTASSIPAPSGLPALKEIKEVSPRRIMNDDELARLAKYSKEFKKIFAD